jgi:protein TonB
MSVFNAHYMSDKNIARIGLSLCVAIVAHIVILYGLSQIQTNKTNVEELLSVPTQVTIRFLTPAKPVEIVQAAKPKPVIVEKSKPVQKKATVKKVKKIVNKKPAITPEPIKQQVVALNNIEPAASASSRPIQPTYPTPQVIPATPAPVVAQIKPAPTPQITPKAIPVVSGASLKGRRTQPSYPARALRMKQEGTVWLHVLISESGERQDIKIHKPTKFALLNQAAIKAVKKWTFTPNMVNGQATKSWVEIPVEFKIQ